jgi:hypothetical protein
MKLKESIPSNSLKIIELYNKIESGVLDRSPDFQRKLVWKKQHKFNFINTILLNYPFPEIYIASVEMDVDELKSKEIVVDGKQRITAIVDYIKGENDFANTKKVKPFSQLSTEEKKDFLNYMITVKDLKDLDIQIIKEIFERINSTDYALNANERLNARYGEGEFTMFCKQILDSRFNPTDDDTDIIIDKSSKEILNNFFAKNNIFSDNDKNRMFDVQFIMLVISTIMEGKYYSRSTLINRYLENYNSSFTPAIEVLGKILKAVDIIENLKLSPGSYWFNKANLFILLVELSKVNSAQIDYELLETKLLNLEEKVDIYFTDEDLSLINEDERKYFEYARQGSNGLTEREHRGKIVSEIIRNSLKAGQKEKDDLPSKNQAHFFESGIDFVIIKPTETGLKKSIMDATSHVREFLHSNGIHDYEGQEFGPDKKVQLKGKFIEKNGTKETTVSLYRANGRGDYRIWFSDLNHFAFPNDELAIINNKGELNILNISKDDYTSLVK